MTDLDAADRAILAALRHDARRPLASLAAELGLARATVKARLDRLVASGVIRGFTLDLGRPLERAGVRAVTLVVVEGRAAERVMGRLSGFREIVALHSTNGRWDIVAELECDSLEAFDALLGRIGAVEGVRAAESHLLLSTRRDLAAGRGGPRG